MKRALLMVCAVLSYGGAGAHSASDAYLTLTADGPLDNRSIVLHGQWDIALRDLDFVLKLDDDGDGQITWGEVKRHWPDIERYAYAGLGIASGAAKCTVRPVRQLIDNHADGAYAVLLFDAVCPTARSLSLNYTLFFKIDPSHRGIFVMHAKDDTSVAVLSPENSTVALTRASP